MKTNLGTVVAGIGMCCVLFAFGWSLPERVAWATGCTSKCVAWTACNGTDVSCPGCDPGVGISCGDVERVQYNPSASYLQRAEGGGSQTANDLGPAICFRRGACASSTTYYVFACVGGGCVTPSPTWCITCTISGSWSNVPVQNYSCTACTEG